MARLTPITSKDQVPPEARPVVDQRGGIAHTGSDYPHPDSTWPNSRQIVEKQMGDLPPAVHQQLTRDNAAAPYGL